MPLRLSLSRLTLLAVLVLPACATERLQGPVQVLHDLATPAPPPAVAPPPAPGPGPGRWRAWVPPQTTAAGDTTAGHWVDLTLAPPPAPVVAPVAPMPRTPKPSHSAPRTLPAAGTPAPSAPGAPVQPALPAVSMPAPGPPGGVVPAASSRAPMLRVPQALRPGAPGVPEEMR